MEEQLRGVFLPIAAETLDDIEHVRIQLENRIRALTRDEPDSDGIVRGPCLTDDHPDVARLTDLLAGVRAQEHEAELYLRRVFRRHPLYPWVRDARGIGEKQGARLLAAIGDPYMKPEIETEDGTVVPCRPRRGPDELKSYTGMDVRDGLAPTRHRGVRANWNATARKRLYLVAESCMKAGGPYRDVYDQERAKYAAAVHSLPCARCGPAGHPAKIGSPLSDGHKHARALRKVGQVILRDLWRESARLYAVNGWMSDQEAA